MHALRKYCLDKLGVFSYVIQVLRTIAQIKEAVPLNSPRMSTVLLRKNRF